MPSTVAALALSLQLCAALRLPVAPATAPMHAQLRAPRVLAPVSMAVEEEEKVGLMSKFKGVVMRTKKEEPAAKKDEEEEGGGVTMQKVKDAGVAGIISYVFWEWAFWGVSVPVCILGYREVTGHWPDLSDSDDLAKLGGEAFAFVNVARFAIPLRIGLALSTTPWVQSNIVDKFQKKDE
eukprot:CAMPEP_0206153178 /NCGR_PEP_ID=MMETSP1474-20131121/458_1 /ASSEMBLY_ACC=CAM_ASM_001110 /TAXON_ID=97495 /ORGANISM="Imantonia sp., Strain RCC918" /LENGTH=179 /DNA_ID=CAMNT_0053550921 /DNA_START=58 /DNA_END=597 /DNA_ORIENTATION=-